MALSRTIGSAGSIQHSMTSSENLTFAGFSSGQIDYGSKWQIIPRLYSTTISVDPDFINEVLYHMNAMYGPPQDKGSRGLIFRPISYCNCIHDNMYN